MIRTSLVFLSIEVHPFVPSFPINSARAETLTKSSWRELGNTNKDVVLARLIADNERHVERCQSGHVRGSVKTFQTRCNYGFSSWGISWQRHGLVVVTIVVGVLNYAEAKSLVSFENGQSQGIDPRAQVATYPGRTQ